MSEPIRTVLIVGGGIVGWSAAAALKRKLPLLDVTMLPLEPPADALADRMSGTLPSIQGFHEDLGIPESDAVARAGSARRAGTLFEGWGALPYAHAYGTVGSPVGGSSFHQVWLGAAARGKSLPFDRYSAAAQAARRGEIAGDAGQGLHLSCPMYRTMMSAFAQHHGVRTVQGNVNGIELRDGGFIRAVQLQGGREIEADLFVDASGPRAVLRGELDDAFESWSAWLAADTLELQLGAADPRPTVLDGNRAIASGWTWTASSARDSSRGHVTSSAFVEADGPGERLSFRQGRRPQPWLRNCVAVGDAAVAVEPLEWTNLHLAHSAIDRLVSMMPDKDCAPVELAEFNRQCGDEANRVRDFLCLHYAAGPPELGPFWRDATTREIPPSLAHTLAMFRERGRLPFYEEETFERDSWLTVLLCQGVRPRRIDPLTDLITPAETARALTALAEQANAGLGQPAPQRVTEGRFER